MGNSGSEPKKKVCKCRSCLHFKVFKDSSFITMEKIYEKTSHEPENEAKGLFICFKHCRLIARDNKQVKHRKKTYFNTFKIILLMIETFYLDRYSLVTQDLLLCLAS